MSLDESRLWLHNRVLQKEKPVTWLYSEAGNGGLLWSKAVWFAVRLVDEAGGGVRNFNHVKDKAGNTSRWQAIKQHQRGCAAT